MKTNPRPRAVRLFSLLLATSLFLTIAGAAVSAPARLDSALRFRNTSVVTGTTDAVPVARPAERAFLRHTYFFDAYLGRRMVRALEDKPSERARGVNALDEVPDGSWFENRIGARPLPPDELSHRAAPPPIPPFVVVGGKVGGVSVGMRVRDALGGSFLLKLDRPDDPDSETATDVVLQRLLWAVGYHTPEDSIVYFREADLHIDPTATIKDKVGVSRPLTRADLMKMLAQGGHTPDGRYRGLASRLLVGKPVGGYPQEGTRTDDANDVIPHEERRDLRGARIFFAWLNSTDIKEDNTLDTWIEDPRTPGRGHVRHNLLDFGNALGVFAWEHEPAMGFTQELDYAHGARSLVSFGLWRRPWEGVTSSQLRGVGNFESSLFDPAEWRARYPWAPFERFDRFDGVWGARILMRVTPAHISAAVAEGQYQDPRAAAFVTRTLIERQRKIARYYLSETSPLERFAVTEAASEGAAATAATQASLCFDDPLLAHFGAGEPPLRTSTRHRVSTWDFAGRPLPLRAWQAGRDRTCVAGITLASDHDGYTIVDIETTRAGSPTNRLLVHIARDPVSRRARVIGLRRL